MSAALNIGPVRPSFSGSSTTDAPPSTEESFGPDFTATTEREVKKPVDPKKQPKSTTSAFGKLGQNQKLRSPVRKLSRVPAKDGELSDLERLEGWYVALGSAAQMFHPKLSDALKMQAEEAALAWFALAEKNDTVRRYILAMIEGGAWGKVIAAHSPIFLAVLPEKVLEKFLLKGMGVFANNMQGLRPSWEMEEPTGD